MIQFLISLVIITYVIIFIKSKKSKYKKIKAQDFPRFIQHLFIRFKGTAFLNITHEATGRYFHFTKYNIGNSQTLNFIFPEASWSRTYLAKFRHLIKAEGIHFEKATVDSIEAKKIFDTFCVVPSLPSIEVAYKVALLAINSMEIPPNASFTANYSKGGESSLFDKVKLLIRKLF